MVSHQPEVFISYSHDSPAHSARVLAFAMALRDHGIDVELDQFHTEEIIDWPRWCNEQTSRDRSDFVLCICTAEYHRRIEGKVPPERGKGVYWEGSLLDDEIYDAKGNLRLIPVLFDDDPEVSIPRFLRGWTFCRLRNFALTDSGYEHVVRILTGQARVVKNPLGKVPVLPPEGPLTTPATTGSVEIAPTRLRHGAEKLFGREQELAELDQTWNDPAKHVLTIVAWGGVGKTSLVVEWMARKASANWPGFERVFDWSFYSQGTREQGTASADTFIADALKFFGDEKLAQSAASPWDKGGRLAQLVAQRRTLMVLDGLEPLQHPPGPMSGQLKDPALAALLRGLAQRNPGLCLVTTREHVADLAPFGGTTAPEWELQHFSMRAGVELLKTLGVQGTAAEFQRLVEDVAGHALTLNLLGRYLAKAHQGDIRKRNQVKFEKADAKIQGGHAFKTMTAYEKWLAQGGEDGACALAVLRLLGLFDRPADAGCLAALRCEPAVTGLTEPLVGLGEDDWNLAISSLEECGLVSRTSADQLKTPNLKLETVVTACREVEQRAAQTLEWTEQQGSLLDVALDHLTLGRAALYRTILEQLETRNPKLGTERARAHLTAAMDGLRRAGTMDHLPRGVLSRAWLRFLEGDLDGARADLDEAWEIAERGPMKLFMADIHLHRAQLFRDKESLAKAAELIRKCGYWRWKEELDDAEEAARQW